MSLDEPDDGRGESASELATKVAAKGPGWERAMAELEPIIRRLARRAACKAGYRARLAQDLEDDAPGYMWERIAQFDPALARFETWCRKVLRNRLIDLGRQAGHDLLEHAKPFESVPDIRTHADQKGLDAALDRLAPLGRDDLERIWRWQPDDRILLLSLTGFWKRVPALTWERWLEECHLDPPFPPPDFAALVTLPERNAVLSSALKTSRNTLSQRWTRKRSLLNELDCVREVRDGL